MKDLDDILEGKEEAPATPEPAPEPVAEPTAADPEKTEAEPEAAKAAEPGKAEAEKAGAEAEPTGEGDGTPPSKDVHIPIAAHLAEREKRQAAEAEAKELRRQLEQRNAQWAQQQAKENAPKRPDPYEDPEGAREYDQAMFDARMIDQKVNMSAEITRQANADYDDVMQDWQQLAQSDPAYHRSLYETAVRQNSPAGWVYNKMKEMRVAREVGDPQEYRTKVEAEIREQLAAEQAAKAEEKANADAQIPQSLAGTPSAAAPRGKAWSGQTPLGNLIGE